MASTRLKLSKKNALTLLEDMRFLFKQKKSETASESNLLKNKKDSQH